jgi:malonate decarboxylase gamma subunit
VAEPERVPLLDAEEFVEVTAEARRTLGGPPSPHGEGAAGAPRRPAAAAALLADLFPEGHAVLEREGLLLGPGRTAAGEVAGVGLAGGTEVGVEAALALATEVLRVVREHPRRPLLALVDSRGQRMSRRDEVLGLAGFLGHLAASVELARRRGHPVIALLHGDAVSGGVLPLGFMADEVHAVETANPWVMSLAAMSRVTKISLERLETLSRSSPVLAPGLPGFIGLGAVESVWPPPLSLALAGALARAPGPDLRARRGLERGGRLLAARVAARVAGGPDAG